METLTFYVRPFHSRLFIRDTPDRGKEQQCTFPVNKAQHLQPEEGRRSRFLSLAPFYWPSA